MGHYIREIFFASLIGVLSPDAFAQMDSINPNDYEGMVYHVTPEMILPEGIYFRATSTIENLKTNELRIVYLECDDEKDSMKLNNEVSYGIRFRFKLEELVEIKNGHLNGCLDNIDYLFPSKSR